MVAPSKGETGNVRLLVKRLAAALSSTDATWEVVFCDDSDDETPAAIQQLAVDGYPVRLNHRRPGERLGGQAGALAEGFAIARGAVLVVMDADLKHPPEVVGDLALPLLAGHADIAVASRYRPGGSAISLDGTGHHAVARASAVLHKALFAEVRRVSDPGSGYYAFRREVVDGIVLKPEQFKMLTEVLVRGRWRRHLEVPVSYAERMYRAPTVTGRHVFRYATHTLRLWMETRVDPQRHAETPEARARCRAEADLLHVAPRPRSDAGAPLDVLVVASELPPVRSGVAESVGRLVEGLRSRGHRVTTVSTSDAWRTIRGEARLSALGVRLLVRRRELRDHDVIHLHGPVPTVSELLLLAAWLRRGRRRPRLVYTHHFDLELPGLGLPSLVYNVVHSRLAQCADRVVTSTPSYARILGGGERRPGHVVVPWGVDAAPAAPGRRPYAGGRPLRVLFVGQQREYKGIPVLIQAVARSTRLEATVVGSGPLLGAHRALVARLGAENVRVVGHVDQAERDELFRTHDVITLPSVTRLEAFGIVLLEGMRVGCVPVASDLAGVRDVVGSCGVLVPPRRAARLCEVLEELADDPVRVQRLAERARRRAAGLSWERCVDAYEDVLRAAVAG